MKPTKNITIDEAKAAIEMGIPVYLRPLVSREHNQWVPGAWFEEPPPNWSQVRSAAVALKDLELFYSLRALT